MSCVNVAEGVMRIWREWLGKMAENAPSSSLKDSGTRTVTEGGRDTAWNGIDGKIGEEQMLWIDGRKNVGIKVTIQERRWRRDQPILIRRDEEVIVSYTIEFEGEPQPNLSLPSEQILSIVVYSSIARLIARCAPWGNSKKMTRSCADNPISRAIRPHHTSSSRCRTIPRRAR